MSTAVESQLLARVKATWSRHRMARGGRRVLVACSGGRDSMALLHILSRLRSELGVELSAVTVSHGLRETESEQRLVEAKCRELRVEWQTLEVLAEPLNGSLQAGARAVRLGALDDLARALAARAVALGHTRSDQAETVLMRLLRGAGTTGLSGMAPVRDRFVRPLIGVSRADVTAYLEAVGVEYCDDPTNRDEAFLRNHVRSTLLPQLEAVAPGLEPRLARTADLLRGDRRLIERWARDVLYSATVSTRADSLALRTAQIRRTPEELWPYVLRLAVARVREGGADLYLAHYDAFARLIARDDGSASCDLPGIKLERRYGIVHIIASVEEQVDAGARPEWSSELPGPGCFRLADGSVLTIERRRRADVRLDEGPLVTVFDAESLRFPLVVRGARRGDRFVPFGMKGRKLLSDLFIDTKVPKVTRSSVQVLTDEADLLWVVGVRRGAHHPVSDATQWVYRVAISMPAGP